MTNMASKITFVLLLAYLTLASSSSLRFTSEFTNLSREQVASVIQSWFPVVIVSNNRATNQLECNDTQYPNGTICLDCKSNGDECFSDLECCVDDFLRCLDGTGGRLGCFCYGDYEWDRDKCVQKTNDNSAQFMRAAQVALGAALVIAVSALSALTCKMCSRYSRARRQLEELQRRDSGASSLNSIQRFVISRLRDRPPRYDDVPDKPPSYVEETPSTTTRPPPPTAPRSSVRASRSLPPNPPEYEEVIAAIPSTSTADPSSLIPPPVESFPEVHTTAGKPPESISESSEDSHNTEVTESSQNTEDSIISSETSESAVLPEYVEIIVPNSIVYRSNDGVDNPAFINNDCHM